MTQEQKELLLKDLCARLPYGVKGLVIFNGNLFMTQVQSEDRTIDGKLYDRFAIAQESWYDNVTIKPYLFPLSSMTEEQKKEFLSAAGYEIREEDCGRHTETYYYDLVGHERDLYPNTEAIDWCRKNHFDIYGLIPMDLAIDATNKNIY